MNKKVMAVSRPRYVILILPIAWLLFSILAIFMVATQEVKTSPSTSELSNLILCGLGTLWVIGEIIYKRYHQISVSVEQKSILVFLLGMFAMSINRYLDFGNALFYVGILLVDILPITAIIMLLRGKSFGPVKLYHKDIQIQ
jgi:hypothetical protein